MPWSECGKKSHEKNRDMETKETKEINGIDAEQAASFQQPCMAKEPASGGYFMTQKISARKYCRINYRFSQ
jgi:hypothetical protein